MPMKARMVGGVAGVGVVIAMLVALTGPWEGLELRAYRDIVGVWTICYGETLGVRPGDVATKSECDATFARRLGEFRAGVDRCMTVTPPVEVEVAVVDLAYNVGVHAVCRSTLMRKLNGGDLRGACNELLNWVRAGGRVVQGLVNRRKAFHQLCVSGL
jgi:lysozyme